ncbi:hypothetical protein C0993_006594, partial [Termitomyces sp. T159_Od127]
MLRRPFTYSLVGSLLGATVATLAVWYYNRKTCDSQEADDPAPSKAPSDASLFIPPTATTTADSISPCAGASHDHLTVISTSDATPSERISAAVFATSRNTLKVIPGADAGDKVTTTSAVLPSGTFDDGIQGIDGAAYSERSITSAASRNVYPQRVMSAVTPSSDARTLAAVIPGASLSEFSGRTSGRTESSQQRYHATSVSSSRKPRDWLSEPLCVVRIARVEEHEPAQGIIIAIERTTMDQVESHYEDCISHLAEFKTPLQVTAIIDNRNNWSLTSLEQFSRALVRLTKDDKERLCRKLTVKFPMTDELESNGGVADLVLPDVVSLKWESHVNQLHLIGLTTFTRLSNLKVRSRLSFRDCQLLLQCASETLESCQIAQVIDNSGSTYAFSKETCTAIELAASDPIVMRELAFLSIDSVLCPGEMLQKFRFRALKVLQLSVQYDFDPERNMNSIPWVGLEEVHMNCHFVYGGAAWVEKSTPNATVKQISSVRNPGV